MSRASRTKSVKAEIARKTRFSRQEEQMEDRTPTQEKVYAKRDHQRMLQQKRIEEMVERGNLTCTKYGLTPQVMDKMLAKYRVLKEKTGGPGVGLLDQMLSVNDDLEKDVASKGRQIRMEQEKRAELEKEANHFRVEDLNYRLSTAMDKAEISELRCRLLKLDSWKQDKKAMEKTIEQIKKEHKSLETSCRKVSEETESIRKIVNNVRDKQLLEKRHAESNARFEAGGISTESEEITMIENSTIPKSPVQKRSESRRPYTGRSRGQTVKLPSICENNKVVSTHSRPAPPKQDGFPSIPSSSSINHVPVENHEDQKTQLNKGRLAWLRRKLRLLM